MLLTGSVINLIAGCCNASFADLFKRNAVPASPTAVVQRRNCCHGQLRDGNGQVSYRWR